MCIWHLYVSGIRCADLRFTPGGVLHAPLDPETAVLAPFQPLSAEAAAGYLALTHFDLEALAGRMAEYERLFPGPPEVETSWGARYRSDDGVRWAQREIKYPWNVTVSGGRLAAFTCPSRERVHVLVREGCEDATVLARWRAYRPEPILPVRRVENLEVPMRDGVALSVSLLLPRTDRPVPAVLVRTPYGKEDELDNYMRYAYRGYAVVLQDVRGRNKSGGAWIPNHFETEDGDDTLNWIAAQNWCDGSVGMVGGSYLGYVQWAAAASRNPHLKALISVVCAGSAFHDLPRKGGSLVSGMLAWAFSVSQQQFDGTKMERDDWDEVLDIRPLADLPRKALGYDIPFFHQWLAHPDNDDFWRAGDWAERGAGVDVPALIVSGWFDDNGAGTTEALDLTADYPDGRRKIILGPWPHSGNARYDLHGLALGNGALRDDIDLIFLQWFDHHLLGADNGAEAMPTVRYYTIGEEKWKTAGNWPVPGGRTVFFYLTPGGGLSDALPEEQGCDSYTYDPADPAEHIIDLSENELGVPEDYTLVEQRPDVLSYTTPALTQPLVLTGDFTVELYVSSDAPDTDFIVRITDVDEHGQSRKLADGVLSARYRDGFGAPKLMEPGRVYKLSIRTSKLSAAFQPGHRLRLTVTSGARNFLFPNRNTGAGFDGTEVRPAENSIHFGGICPSRVIAWQEIQP